MQNLLSALSAWDPAKPVLVGRRRPTPVGIHYDMRAGLVISRAAAELVVAEGGGGRGKGRGPPPAVNAARAAELVLRAGGGGGGVAGPGAGGTEAGVGGAGLVIDDPSMLVDTPGPNSARPGYVGGVGGGGFRTANHADGYHGPRLAP